MPEDYKVEATYHPDDSGEFGTFTFSLPNADIALRFDLDEEGRRDASDLIENLPELILQMGAALQDAK